MTDHAELIEQLRAEASGMTNLSQSAWGIAEPVMLGEKLDFDKALHGFFMAVYEYCDGTASAHRQAATALSALVAERDALAAEVAKLREALEPFAALADVHMGESNDARRWPAVKVGWLRAARAALAQGGEKP